MVNNDLTLKVGFDIAKFQGELNKTTGVLNKWSAGVQNSLLGLAAGFSAIKLGEFVLDVSRLAGEADGVRAAFNKLPDSIMLMKDLKDATGGTVSELELMKRAVMASNFDISLKALPQLLEFATVRAQQTGQSVDYLVDSIVTGIGRKSKLILDNLGISAVQLTEALGGASTAASSIGQVAEAVGKIAEDSLNKTGRAAVTAATQQATLNAEWINFKVALGDVVNASGLPKVISLMSTFLKQTKEAFGGGGFDPVQRMKQLTSAFNDLDKTASKDQRFSYLLAIEELSKKANIPLIKLRDEATGLVKIFIKPQPVTFVKGVTDDSLEAIGTVGNLREQIKELNEFIEGSKSSTQIDVWQKQIEGLEKRIEVLLNGSAKKRVIAESPAKSISDIIKPVESDKKVMDAASLSDRMTQIIAAANEKQKNFLDEMSARYMNMANVAITAGDSIGQAMSAAFSGDGVSALRSATMQIVDLFQKQALAAIIAKATKDGVFKPGVGTIVALTAAAAGFAAIKSLFARIGAGGSGGGGLSGGVGEKMQGNRLETLGQRVQLVGSVDFNIQGIALKGVLKNQDRFDGRTRTTS